LRTGSACFRFILNNGRKERKGNIVADTEEEQLDAIRAWWSEHGKFIISIVVVGAVMYFGWNKWQSDIAENEIAASLLYEEVMTAAARDNLETASVPAEVLFSEHNDSAYAGQARLAMARLYMDSARDQDAADTLRALVESNPDKELAQVGRLRLAKILLYQGKAEEVVELLEASMDSAFMALFSEALGDAYAAMGSYALAQEAYVNALGDNVLVPTVDTNLIQLKLNDLPVIGEVEAALQDPEAAGDEASSVDSSAMDESPADDSSVEPSVAEEPSMNNTASDDERGENPQNEMPAEGEVGAE